MFRSLSKIGGELCRSSTLLPSNGLCCLDGGGSLLTRHGSTIAAHKALLPTFQCETGVSVRTVPKHKKSSLGAVVVTYPKAETADPSAPVVVLLGWAGSVDRNLAQYSKIYEQQGCTTVRYTAPMYTFHQQDRENRLGESLYLYLFEDMNLKDRPFIVHTFSNNGWRKLYRLIQSLPTDKDRESVRARFVGVVFDSGPGDPTPHQSAQAVMHALWPQFPQWSPSTRGVLTGAYTALFTLARAARWIQSFWDQDSSLDLYSWPSIRRLLSITDELPERRLYLYSKGDNVCTDKAIEHFISKQKKGDKTTRVRFDKSPHCEHLRFHYSEYRDAVSAFLNECRVEQKHKWNPWAHDGVPGTPAHADHSTAKSDVDRSDCPYHPRQ